MAQCKSWWELAYLCWGLRCITWSIGLGGLAVKTNLLQVTLFYPSRSNPGPEIIKLLSCSTHVSMKIFLLINVKMPTIVGILTFISRKNSFLGLPEPEKSCLSWYFYAYEHLKFHAQLNWAWIVFITSGPVFLNIQAYDFCKFHTVGMELMKIIGLWSLEKQVPDSQTVSHLTLLYVSSSCLAFLFLPLKFFDWI